MSTGLAAVERLLQTKIVLTVSILALFGCLLE